MIGTDEHAIIADDGTGGRSKFQSLGLHDRPIGPADNQQLAAGDDQQMFFSVIDRFKRSLSTNRILLRPSDGSGRGFDTDQVAVLGQYENVFTQQPDMCNPIMSAGPKPQRHLPEHFEACTVQSGDAFLSRPVVLDGMVVCGSQNGYVWGHLATDGSGGWRRTLSGAVDAALSTDGRRVFVPCLNHNLYAINASTGIAPWITRLPGRLDHQPEHFEACTVQCRV